MTQNTPQVLVVGAGPTGLGAAIELRRRGISCRIIERRQGPVHTSRAITVHARTLEMLEDMGVVGRFLHGGVRNDGYIFNFKGSDVKPGMDIRACRAGIPTFVCSIRMRQRRFCVIISNTISACLSSGAQNFIASKKARTSR